MPDRAGCPFRPAHSIYTLSGALPCRTLHFFIWCRVKQNYFLGNNHRRQVLIGCEPWPSSLVFFRTLPNGTAGGTTLPRGPAPSSNPSPSHPLSPPSFLSPLTPPLSPPNSSSLSSPHAYTLLSHSQTQPKSHCHSHPLPLPDIISLSQYINQIIKILTYLLQHKLSKQGLSIS